MAHLIARICINACALLLVAYVLPGIAIVGIKAAFIAALLLGIANAIVRPILILLTLPITLLTLGLFIFVINGALFWWISGFVDGFTIDSPWYALLGSVLMSIISSYMSKTLK